MASQASFSVERLQRFGSEAARKQRRKQEIGHAATFACEYLGVSTREACFDAALDAKARSRVGFEWRVTAGAFEAWCCPRKPGRSWAPIFLKSNTY